MSNLYINNTQFPKLFADSMNSVLNSLCLRTNNKDITLQIDLPQYDNEDIINSYIHNLGTIAFKKKNDINRHEEIMLAIFMKYPEYVHLKTDNLSDNQILHIIETQSKHVVELMRIGNSHIDSTNVETDNANSITYNIEHNKDHEPLDKNTYHSGFNEITNYLSDNTSNNLSNNVNHTNNPDNNLSNNVQHNTDQHNDNLQYKTIQPEQEFYVSKDMFEYNCRLLDNIKNTNSKSYHASPRAINKLFGICFRRYSYNKIIYSNGIIKIDTPVLKRLFNTNMFRYMQYMYDQNNKNIVRVDHNAINYCNNVKYYTKHPYGYREHMIKVHNVQELLKHIKDGVTRHIYLNGDIDLRSSKENVWDINVSPYISEIQPEDFATWAVGPKCKAINYLFYKYQSKSGKQPQVSSWKTDHLTSCCGLFSDSNVSDLSNMLFYSCKNASHMFHCCRKLTKAPKFYSLVDCSSMFSQTPITGLDDVIMSTKNIEKLGLITFKCRSIKHTFNNRVFNKLKELDISDVVSQTNIQTAFNNCVFKNLVELEQSAEGEDICSTLESTLNNCHFGKTLKTLIIRFEDKRYNVKRLFNDCTSGKEKSKSNCVNYEGSVIIMANAAESIMNNVILCQE